MAKLSPLQFLQPEKKYVLVNGTDEAIEFQWDGQVVRVPRSTDTVPRHPKYDDVFHSYEIDGRLEPGTLLVWDIRKPGLMGASKTVWSCEDAIREKLGVKVGPDGEPDYARQTVGARGLGVVLVGATRDEIEEARFAGRRRWALWQRDTAVMVVAAQEDRNAKLRRQGLDPEPDTEPVLRARIVLQEMKEQELKEAKKRLGLDKRDEVTRQAELDSLTKQVLGNEALVAKLQEHLLAGVKDQIAEMVTAAKPAEPKPRPPEPPSRKTA